MNVLILTDGFFPEIVGGISKSILDEIKGLIAKRHKVVVLTRMVKNIMPFFENIDGIHIYRHPSIIRGMPLYHFYPLYSVFHVYKMITHLIKKEKIDIINAHYPFPSFAAAVKKTRVAMVHTFHAPLYDEIKIDINYGKYKLPSIIWIGGILTKYIEKLCFRRSSKVVCRSLFTKDILLKKYSIKNSDIATIPIGVNVNRYKQLDIEKHKLRKTLNLPIDKKLFLTIRRLEGRMGVDTLINAINIINKRNKEVIEKAFFIIGGKGYLYNQLVELIKKYNLDPYINLIGFIPEEKIVEYYNAVDFFILPTQALEGFGLSTIESLSCGTPVLGTPVGATPEILMQISPDLIFRGKTALDIADGLEKILGGEINMVTQRNRCRKIVEKFYSNEVVADMLESEFYKALRFPK